MGSEGFKIPRNITIFTISSLVFGSLMIGMGAASVYAQTEECDDLNLESGDLVKVEGNSAVYLITQGLNRMYFPNAAVYMSWYDNFDAVVTVPGICLELYPYPEDFPRGVSYRPGSKLVKTNVAPAVYAIEPGYELVKISDPNVASALYGTDWESDLVDIHDVYWVNYERTGRLLAMAHPHDGMLIQLFGTTDVYYVAGDQKHLVNGTLSANTRASVQVVGASTYDSIPTSGKMVTESTIRANPAMGMHGQI